MALVVLKLDEYEQMTKSGERAKKELEKLKKEISKCSAVKVIGPGSDGDGLNFPKVRIEVDKEKILKLAARYSIYHKGEDLDWVDTDEAKVELVDPIKGKGGILTAILNIATEINKAKTYTVSIEYLGHLDKINVRIIEGVWEEGKQAFYTKSVNIDAEESCTELLEILEMLTEVRAGNIAQ